MLPAPIPDWIIPALFLFQGALGGFDTLVNHEWIERLPRKPEARTEIGWHSLRELLYAVVFAAVAWGEWRGAGAFAIAALLAIEMAVSMIDEAVENRTRVLPANERQIHALLTLNAGALIALLVLEGFEGAGGAAPVAFRDMGLTSIALSLLALAAFAWAVRDALAWHRLGLRPA